MSVISDRDRSINVTVVNGVEKADIWIIPQTQENLKTSLWGAPDVSALDAGQEKNIDLCDTCDGRYIIRMIDKDKALYAVRDITLKNGYTVRFRTDDTKYEARIEIIDKNGIILSSSEAFEGILG